MQQAHKVKELASRQRSINLHCDSDGNFTGETNPADCFLVIDGDWPINSKINLYESGYLGVVEIGELDQLTAALQCLIPMTEDMP
jgi:hypothetical protein